MMATGDARVIVPNAISRGDVIYVRALIEHPMDTGFFRTAQGAPIPAYFIHDVVVTYGDETVARFVWTSGISRDPSVTFPIKATREAPVTVTWTDNKGGVYRQSADIRFAAHQAQ
jgi:sulfur-oxidizing protein SoxZ